MMSFLKMIANVCLWLVSGCGALVAQSQAGNGSAPPAYADSRVSEGVQSYWVEQVAEGLKFPSSMAWLPDGNMLITERLEDNLRIVRNGKLDPVPISGTPSSFRVRLNGLKDVLVDPDFPTNKTLYLLLTEGTLERHYAAVYSARYTQSGLTDLKRIFRCKDELLDTGAASTRMMFLGDKTLLIGVPANNRNSQGAQQLSSHIGKLLRIARDGSVPADNPFLTTAGALQEIWTYGHRETLGLFQDETTGEIWEVESGPRGGDEFNVLKPGKNYGWATATWGFDYTGKTVAPRQFGGGIEDPLFVWMPPDTRSPASPTPSGLTRYRGKTYPAWDGDFFVGTLSGKALERLRFDRDNRLILRERMLLDLDERIRDVKVGPDNRIYILTDHQNGRVLRLQPGVPRLGQHNRVARKLELKYDLNSNDNLPRNLAPGDAVKGQQAFLEHCSACHSVGTVVPGGAIGPDLAGVYGRNAGSLVGFNYSAAMAGSPQVWTDGALVLFLTDPSRYWPGTAMAAPPMTDPQLRLDIVEFLKHQSSP